MNLKLDRWLIKTKHFGINQNLEIGQNIYGLNSQISDSKMRMADIQTQMAMFQGLQGFGQSVAGIAGKASNLATNFLGQTAATTPMNFGPTYGQAINYQGRGAIY